MLFVIQPSAMHGVEVILNALDAILLRVEGDVHELEIIQADDLASSDWYLSLSSRPTRQKLLEEIAKTSFNRAPRQRGPHLQRVVVSDTDSAMRAQNLAHTPLIVLAENDISDGTLIEEALRVFGGQQTLNLCFETSSRLDPPAFQIESRGGHGALPKLLNRRLEEARARGRPPRLVVVTDGDGEWSEQVDGEWTVEVKDHAVKIRNDCATNGIPCPPLDKRTAENYIPDEVWRAWAAIPAHTRARPAVEALLRLSCEQRDHVHMAAPDTPPWNPTNPKAATLFQGVSDLDRNLLTQANLKGKGDTMMIFALRDHRAALTASDLQARDHRGDLMNLVRQIEDNL